MRVDLRVSSVALIQILDVEPLPPNPPPPPSSYTLTSYHFCDCWNSVQPVWLRKFKWGDLGLEISMSALLPSTPVLNPGSFKQVLK